MRYVYLAAIVALSVSVPSVSNGQNAPFSIANYQIVGRQDGSSSLSSITYRAELVNPGPAAGAVTATVSSRSPRISVVPGQHNLHFSPVPANGSVASSDTFTILADSAAPFDPTDLHWSFTAPVANAGRGQTAGISSTVTLDGSGSTNPSATGTLTYSWEFTSRPAGSSARLDNETSPMPSFVVDVPGDYAIALTVSNGAETDSATVKVSTRNTPPVANAGPNQTVGVGATVIHNGSGSSDVDGNALTYSWTLVTKPAGSAATLSAASTVSPTFVVDKPGIYIAQLVVNDGLADSAPSTVTVTTQNTPPVAHAGRAQVVTTGALVQLNGAGSTDVDGNPLTYSWSLITLPAGSKAALTNLTAVNPAFTADVPGTYVAQLIVNDGFVDSTPETVAITTNALQAPLANAGPNQTVTHNSTVVLSGSGVDLQSLPLTYQLALIAKPAGSNAVLSIANSPNATFVADLPGTYVAQLIVNNGVLSSPPATVTITTTNTAPVANAGRSQNVAVGANVQLDGSASSDADRDPLTHSWSLTSRPNGSAAALFSPTAKSPMFVADVAGTYVAQLIVNDGYTNSYPSTVTITASAAPAITLTPNRLNLGRGRGTLTVNLSAPAGEGGQEVDLAISDGDVASVPARVVIPQGSTGANVSVPRGTKGGNATITASAMSFASATAEVVGTNTINLPTVAVAPGQQVAFPVTITPAPTSTVFVTLSSSNTATATLSATTLVFDAGSTTPTSTPQLEGVALGSVTITASATNFTTVTETIQVAANIAFVPSTLTVPGVATKNLNLVLSSAAPAGGQVINLSSTNASIAAVPATVTIAANTTNVSVPVTGVAFGTTTIDASAATLANTTATVTVASAGTVNLPASASVGNLQTVTFPISLSSAAPTGGTTVTLSSTDPATLTISPATVTIAAGSTTPSTQPTITGVAIGSASIDASAPGYTSSSLLVPVNNVQISIPTGASVGLTASTSFPVTLATPAPAGGLTVTLTSSNTSTVSVTSSVTVAAGATTPTTQPQVKGVNVGSANITATAPGYISATQPVSVTASVSFTPAAISVAATASATVTLTLSAAAPTGGVTVNLSSGNTGLATVPATISFAANSKTATFAVAGVAAGSTTITAGAPPNIPNATLTVTVTPPGTIGTQSGLSVGLTQSVSFPITLSTPAPTGGVTVTLTSDNASTVSISPGTVQIAANAVTPATQPQVTGVNLGSANITASAPGYNSATQSVNGTATVTLSPSTSTVGLNSSQNLTLTLSAKAPAGGLTVNLNSTNASIATVPSMATFSAGATTTPVTLTALGNLGSTVIQGSATGIPMATANVTVAQLPLILLPSSITVALGKTASLGISLQTAAPTGGVTVTLTSSNSSATVTPSSVTIAAGQMTPTTQPNVTGVNFPAATISATAAGYASSSVPVLVNTTAALSPTSATIIGTNTSTFTITLGASAPAGGVTITLNSSNPSAATVPASVTIATGTSATFAVTGVAPGTTTITASATPNIGSVTANVTVNPLGTITLNPATPGLGQSAAFPITISPAAPAGGVTIALSSSNTSIAKTSVTTVTIPANQTTSSPNITGVNLGSATITASATNYTTATQQAQVTATVTVSPLSLVVGNTANMTLTLSAAAPTGGITVNLGSSNTSVATVPATATFGAGQSTITVPVTALAAGTSVIDAYNPAGIAGATGTVTVNPPGIISIPSAPTVGLKSSAQFPITLLTPAPTGGVTLTLSSSNTSMVTVSPASITIAAGLTTPTVQPNITGANIGSANITVSAPNYTTSTAAAQVTGTLTGITPASPLIYGTATQTFTLTLSTTAPTGGITLSLSSSNTGVATVPATVTIPANASTVTFVATGVAAGQTTITAGLPPNIANISTSLTDANPGTITLNPLSLGKGQAGQFQILLTPAPPVNTTVTLSSSNTSIATVTSSVTVTAGSMTPATQPTVTGNNFGSATITASAYGYVTASEAVPVGDTIAFPSNTLTINGSGTQNLSLTLSAPAPAGGFVINLSSSNTSVATVPSTVTFAQNSTSVNVPVTAPGLTFGTTTITASELPNIAATTATVTVQSAGTIQIAPTTVTLGSPATFNVSLPAPATSNVTVSLTSSNTSVATISPASVTITAGNTTPTTQPKVTAINLGSVNVTASAAGYTAGVQPFTSIATVSYSPSSLTIVGGAGTGTFKLTLSGAAPSGGLTVSLSSSDTTIATVPASATFTAGQTTATFTVTGVAAGTATITASSAAGVAATTANVTVTPPGTITLNLNGTPGLGQAQTLAVTLNPAAPTGGTTVTLSSSNTSIATVTSTATVAAGNTIPATQPKVTGVAYGTVTITVSAPGYVTTTQSVQVIDSVAFTAPALTLTGPVAGTLTLTLSAPAPAAGITVNLSSSNASVATVNAMATFTSGLTAVSVPVTGLNIGSTTITASSTNIAPATATVTVQTAGPFTMPAATSVNLGGTATYAVKIPIAAPTGGVTVSLTSSNPAITVPATFTIPAGSTQASVSPKLTGFNIGSATITASAPGFTATTSPVNTVVATVTLPASTLNITGPKTSNITATLSAVAPTGGVTINVISSNIAVATVPATVTFAAGSSTATIPVTATGVGNATITASLSPNIPSATANVTVTSQGTIQIPSNVNVPLGQSSNYNVTLQAGAPSPGITVNLASSNSSTVSISPASVFIAAGATAPATQPQVTGVDIGSVTITASSPVYTTGSQTALVTGVVTPSPSSLSITGIGSANLTLTLNVSAPSGGVTINLSSSNTSIAIVPATATFQPGSNTVVVPVNSVNVGSATITASLLPSIPNATAAVTVSPAGTLSLGPAVSVTVGQSGALALSVSPAAPVGGVTVNLASSNTSLAAVTPSIIVIPAGQTTPSTQPQVNANGVGNVSITATAPGFTAATPVTAAVNDTVSFPSTTTIIQLPAKATSFTQNIPLTVAVPMPVAVTLNLSSSNPNVATVPSTVTIPANATTVQVPVTGISGAGGAVTIHANKTPNIPDVTASVFVKNPPVGTITIAPVSVGQGLEAQITVTLSSPQMTDTNVPIYTSDPTKALIAGRVADPGTPSVIATVAAGTTSAGGIYVQGLVSSGTVQIYTLTTNFVDANTTVTLQPAGFVLSGPNPIGNQTFATGQGTTTTLTVSAAMLNSSLDFVAVQPVANNGSTPAVNVTSSNTSIGAITASPVTFTAGASSETTSFVAAGTSATSAATVTLSVSVPSGFSMPADDNSLTATVNGTGMTTSNVSVGNGLETQATVTLNGNATVSTVVTITSPSSSVLFSATSTGTGAQSLTLTIPPQFSHTPPFYVYGKANSGTVTYTVSAPNFNPASGTVTLQPAGFVMQGPLGLGSSSFPASLGTTQGITVIAAMLNASGGYVAQQAVAGPNSVTINLTSSNTAVGTITSPVVIAGGTSNSIATFTPVGPGTSSITMSTPGGFSTPTVDTQLNATIAPQSVQVTTGVTVGNQLALQGTVNLSQAPSSNETVTLTATGNILLAVNPTDAGSGSIQITITAGSTQGNYYIYGLANSGTATYSATASGYTNGSGTVTLAPSGVVIAGPNGLGAPVTTNAATPVTLTLYTGTLDPTHSNNFSNIEQLAGFVTSGVTVTIDDLSGGAYGALSPNPVTIPAGANSGTETFTPSGDSGNVPFTLQVVTPTGGFTTAHSDASVQMAVNN